MRIHFHTFGCKANQYDTERMRQEAEARGAEAVASWNDADACVVNTSTVTSQADADARRFVRRITRENPSLRVVVAGCSATLRGAAYRAMSEVEGVVEGHDPVAVAGALLPFPLARLGLRVPLDRIATEPVGGELLLRRAGATRGWLKVQDGCDRKCAFCATRLARGTSRSRSPEDVVREATSLAAAHPELVITGIHIGHYGLDLDPPWTLARLVARLLEALPGTRLRLGSVEATEVDAALLDLLATSGGMLAPHLHMPLQSGSDAVLGRMRRWHTREQYRRRALEIVERVGAMGLGADILTAFPGETDEDHALTRSLVEELPFTYLHVFPYSPRAGTSAVELPGRVPQAVAGARSRELRELGLEKGRAYRAGRVGTRAQVVLEDEGATALTGDYLRAEVREPPPSSGGLLEGALEGEGGHLHIAWPRRFPPN